MIDMEGMEEFANGPDAMRRGNQIGQAIDGLKPAAALALLLSVATTVIDRLPAERQKAYWAMIIMGCSQYAFPELIERHAPPETQH